MRGARPLAVARHLNQPAGALQIGRNIAAEHQEPVVVEVLQISRRAEFLQIFGRGIDVEMHRKQLALNEIRLGRLAQPDGDIGLAHRQIKLLVGGKERDVDLGIEVGELAQPRSEPMHADAGRGGHP